MEKNEFIFGIRTVLEAIKAEKEIDKVLIKEGLKGELFNELFQVIRTKKVPYQFVPENKISKLTNGNHQGVIAYLQLVSYWQIEDLLPALFESEKNPLVLILDGITDIRNLGAIARSAECSGANAIIIPVKGSAQINPEAIKASAGALHLIPVAKVINLRNTAMFLKESGFKILAATEKAESLIYSADFKQPTAIIMGSEDKGISTDLLKIADQLVKIPILGKIESLNVSVAASILLYEAVRQRNN